MKIKNQNSVIYGDRPAYRLSETVSQQRLFILFHLSISNSNIVHFHPYNELGSQNAER